MTHTPLTPRPSDAFVRALREEVLKVHPAHRRQPWLRWSAYTLPALAFTAFILFLQQEPLSAVHFLEKAQAATASIFDGVWHTKERTTSADFSTPDNVVQIAGSRFIAPNGKPSTREQWYGMVNGLPALRTRDTLDDGTLIDDSIAVYPDDWMLYPIEDYRLLPKDERNLIAVCVQRVPAFVPPNNDAPSLTDTPPSELPDDQLAWQLTPTDQASTVATLAEMVKRGVAHEVQPVLPGTRSFRVDEYGYVWGDDGDFVYDTKGNPVRNNDIMGFTVYTFDEKTYLLKRQDRHNINTEGVYVWTQTIEFLLQERLPEDEMLETFNPIANGLIDPWTLLPMTKAQIVSHEAETGCYLNGVKRGENEYDLEPLGEEIYSRVINVFAEDPTIKEPTGW